MSNNPSKGSSLPVLLWILGLILAGCTTPKTVIDPASVDISWPPPPAEKRISFVSEMGVLTEQIDRKGFVQRIFESFRGTDESEISRPYGLTVGDTGAIYIVDNGYQAIHVLDRAQRKYWRFPQKAPQNFENPVNIAIGRNGRVFVSDSGSGVVHIFAEGGKRYLKSLSAPGMERPTGLAINPVTQELLVLDTKKSQLYVFDEVTGSHKKSVGTNRQTGSGEPVFHFPTNIAVTAQGRIYIADSLNFRIQILSPDLKTIGEFGAPGNAPGSFSRPKGVAVDSDGHVYVIDALFDNVQIFDPDGSLLLAFGGPGSEPGKFWLPNAIYIDRQDRIYVSDSFNQRIQIFQYWNKQK